MKTKAQATLEFMVTFAIMVILLFSLLSLWKKWCDKIIDRQRKYSQDRVKAGTYNMGLGDYIPYLPDY